MQFTLLLRETSPAQLALDPCTGAVVVTDVSTGEVLSLVSYPGYDNNKMANSINAEYFAKLNSDKANPQINWSISENSGTASDISTPDLSVRPNISAYSYKIFSPSESL